MFYVDSLPVDNSSDTEYSLLAFVGDLIDHAQSHLTSNAVVVPVLQTFNVLLEADTLERLLSVSDGLERFVYPRNSLDAPTELSFSSLRVLISIISKNVHRLKSVVRIQESMKM